MNKSFFILMGSLLIFEGSLLGALIGIDIVLPQKLKGNIASNLNIILSDENVVKVKKEDLSLTVQYVTQEGQEEKVIQAVSEVAKNTAKFSVQGLLQPASISNQFGSWLVAQVVAPQGGLKDLLSALRQELIKRNVEFVEHNPFVTLGFTQGGIDLGKRGVPINFAAETLYITKTELKRENFTDVIEKKDMTRIVNHEAKRYFPLQKVVQKVDLESALAKLTDSLTVLANNL